ncbi:MAG: N-acetylmuramic acid 6-phosphate etherase [Terriglobales bacterium]
MSNDLDHLGTEALNPASADLDTKSALEIARIINAEDATVAAAVSRALPQIAQAIDLVTDVISAGGRLIYVGAGTSGRIAALDAAECPPTFNVEPHTVQFVIAGGTERLANAREADEDSSDSAQRDLARRRLTPRDVVAALAASGRTPYTLAALEAARAAGAKTISITCNPGSPMGRAADLDIVADVGPEVVAGSTRMKAATAEKMICNIITTGAMTRLGYIYGNLMVNVRPENEKLVLRAIGILQSAAAVDHDTAARALRDAGNSVPVALIMLKAGVDRANAEHHLRLAGGHVRRAIESASPLSTRRSSRK